MPQLPPTYVAIILKLLFSLLVCNTSSRRPRSQWHPSLSKSSVSLH